MPTNIDLTLSQKILDEIKKNGECLVNLIGDNDEKIMTLKIYNKDKK